MDIYDCNACGKQLLPFQTVVYGDYGNQRRNLCVKCYNKTVTDEFDCDFEHKEFSPTTLEDMDGRQHEFHFSYQIIGNQIIFSAREMIEGEFKGYRFSASGDLEEDDLRALYLRLFAKICQQMSRKHVENGCYGWQITENDTIRARVAVEPDNPGLPVLVIDGREFSWEEFGQMLTAYEDFNLKLQLFDMCEQC